MSRFLPILRNMSRRVRGETREPTGVIGANRQLVAGLTAAVVLLAAAVRGQTPTPAFNERPVAGEPSRAQGEAGTPPANSQAGGRENVPRRYLSAGLAAVYAHHTWDFPGATAFSPSAGFGLVPNDRYTFEIELSRPTPNMTHVEEGVFSLAPRGASPDQVDSRMVTSRREYSQEVPFSISVLLGRRLRPWGRSRVALLGGLSSQARRDITTIELPDLSASGPSELRVQRSERTRYVGALTGGVDLAITLPPRAAIVPQVRLAWWGLEGVTFRSGVSVRWAF